MDIILDCDYGWSFKTKREAVEYFVHLCNKGNLFSPHPEDSNVSSRLERLLKVKIKESFLTEELLELVTALCVCWEVKHFNF